jgi:hypothetical protein
MGLADRDYMHERHRAAREEPKHFRPNSRREIRDGQPNWLAAILIVAGIALASYGAYRLLSPPGAVPFPRTGLVNWYVPAPDPAQAAPLRIQAPIRGDRSYALLLKERHSGRLVALIPVRKGEYAEVDVPLGEYEIQIASGISWQGPEKLFGRTGDLQKAVAPMHFFRRGNERVGHRIDLTQRFDGNLQTRPVSPFDR